MKKAEKKHAGKKRAGGLFKLFFCTAMLCMFVPLLITVVFTVRSVYRQIESMETKNLIQMSCEKMNMVNLIIENQAVLVRSVADSPYIAQTVADGYHAGDLDESVTRELQNYMEQIFTNANGLYENFFITCGTMGATDGFQGDSLHDVAEEAWYQACISDGFFLGNNISPVTGKPVCVIAYAIYDLHNKEAVGTVNCSIDLAVMTSSITESAQDSNMQVMIADGGGNVIASSYEEQILSLNLYEENDSTAAAMNEISKADTARVSFELNGESNIGAVNRSGSMITFVYIPEKIFSSVITSLLKEVLAAAIVCVFLAAALIVPLSGSIVNPLKQIAAIVERNGNADFSQKIPGKLLRRKDEIGMLAVSMEKMQGDIRILFQEILHASESMKQNVSHSNERMSILAEKIGTVNELASERAENLKQNAENSQKRADKLITEMNQELSDAIGQSREVVKINDLSESILDISSKTSLLALNASIEAARAGEQGKGFAVVAGEISKLAADSQNTVGEIKKVTEQVLVAVQNLSSSAKKVTGFIGNNVIADYQTMIDIGEQYFQDSLLVKEFVSAVSQSSAELSQAMENIAGSLKEISDANNDGAAGITGIVENMADISFSADGLLHIMASVGESTGKLEQSVHHFTV